MKKLLLTLLALSSSFLALAQGTWTSRTSLPDSGEFQGIMGFSIGNYGYAGLGQYGVDAKYFDALWQFDASTDSWTKKANFPGSARVAPASFVVGDKAYLVCGSVKNFGTCVTECWEYNSTTDTWTQKANFPGPARTYAIGFAIGGKGYVGTGANELSDFRKDFYAYDTAGNGSWTRVADFGGIARSCACGFAVNGKGYVCFGQDSNLIAYNDMWEYDPGTNAWTQKSNAPTHFIVANGFVICNNIYVGSGDTAQPAVLDSIFYKYNTVSDTWTQEASVPGNTKVEGVAFSIVDTGYFGLGAYVNYGCPPIFDKFFAGDSCNSSEGYHSIKNASDISIYPNPVSLKLTIKFNEQPVGLVTLSIMDITGREVSNYQVTMNNYQLTVDVSSLSSAMYFISIKNKDRIVTQKIIKE